MDIKKNNLIDKIYKISFSVFTIILGLLFILFTFTIYFKGKEMIVNNPTYQIYTKEIVSKYLSYLIVPLILWILLIIGGFIISHFFPVNKKRIKADEIETYYKLKDRVPFDNDNYTELISLIKKERKLRNILFLIISVIGILCMIFPARYLFNFNNFTNVNLSMKEEAIKMAFNVFPWIIGVFFLFAMYLIFFSLSIKKETEFIKEILKTYKTKENKKINNNVLFINITRVCILVIGIIFVFLGIFNGGVQDVLVKAINICTECIGLA